MHQVNQFSPPDTSMIPSSCHQSWCFIHKSSIAYLEQKEIAADLCLCSQFHQYLTCNEYTGSSAMIVDGVFQNDACLLFANDRI